MGSRSIAQIAPTSATIALNAYIFGFGGHSLVTPHAALTQLWWTDERIEQRVTRAYVVSKLRGQERDFLDRPLAFGEGLTDDTYMEWILDKAKRLFVILTEVGVPDQIFGCIDDCWADEDLPISAEDVAGLDLSMDKNDALNKKFYDTQFLFLLRELKPGDHIDYGPREHIPMEHVNSLPPAVALQMWDRIHFPGRVDDIFMRRKYALVDKETGQRFRETFLRDVAKARLLAHEHIAPVWASYTADNAGYILSDLVGEHTLQTFIDHRTPAQWMRVPAVERPFRLAQWMHCLADALAFIHHAHGGHTAVRPSNIIIDSDNRIAFADVGSLRFLQRGKKVNRTETYNYAAPETQISTTPFVFPTSTAAGGVNGAFSRLRKFSATSNGSSTASSSTGSSTRSNSISTLTSTASPPIGSSSPPARTNRFSNFSRHLSRPSSPPDHRASIKSSETTASSILRPLPVLAAPSIAAPEALRDLPSAAPDKTDIFSLGCIYLDIVTFMVKGRTTDFVKFRTTTTAAPAPNTSMLNTNNSGINPASSAKRTRLDTSFHAAPERLDAWARVLTEEARKRAATEPRAVAAMLGAVPAFLALAHRMMAQNAALRPTALEVRDALYGIIANVAGLDADALCCAHRCWPDVADQPPSLPGARKSSGGGGGGGGARGYRPPLGGGRRASDEALIEEDEAPYIVV